MAQAISHKESNLGAKLYLINSTYKPNLPALSDGRRLVPKAAVLGTVIVQILALARKPLLLPSMAPRPYHNERSRTILIVEDEAVIRYILHIVLKRMGHLVLEAWDGAEGLTLSRKFNDRIDLVIADVRMPRMDGPTMVRHLQAERPGTKVLFISGDSTESVPNDQEFLHKPFLPAVIARKVQELLAPDKAISTVRR
jgi:CheY-like chemotaxis protein